MSYTIRHLFGDYTAGGTNASEFSALFDELSRADGEHTDVGVGHDSGWSLSVFASGVVIFENVEDDGGVGPRHMHGVGRDQVLRLWHALAKGDRDELEREPWKEGYR